LRRRVLNEDEGIEAFGWFPSGFAAAKASGIRGKLGSSYLLRP